MYRYSRILDYARKGHGLMVYLKFLNSRNAFEKAKKLIKYVGRSINGVIIEPSTITIFGLEYISKIFLPYVYGIDLISVADHPLVSYADVNPSIFKEYGFDMLITDPLYINSHAKEFELIRDDDFAVIVNLYRNRGKKARLVKYASKVKICDAFYVEGSPAVISRIRRVVNGFIIAREGPGGDVNVITMPLNEDIYSLVKKVEDRLERKR